MVHRQLPALVCMHSMHTITLISQCKACVTQQSHKPNESLQHDQISKALHGLGHNQKHSGNYKTEYMPP